MYLNLKEFKGNLQPYAVADFTVVYASVNIKPY
jgi:hypothetical protein